MNIKGIKKSMLTMARHMIQIVSFLLFPGLFISVLAALKDIVTTLASGNFDVASLSQQLILSGGVLLITAVMGRFFCGFLCSFGAMGDLLWFIRKKLKLPRLTISETADRRLKLLKYVLLLGIVSLIWTGIIAVDSLWNPWTIFGMYASVKGWSAPVYLVSVGGALLLLIMIGSLFIQRFFCRYLCPLGALFAGISQFRLFRIKKPGKQCGLCRACTAGCIMGIPLYRGDMVTSGECIDCFHCIEVCPRNNISANPTPAVAAIITVGALTGLYYVGNLSASGSSDVPQTSVSSVTAPSGNQPSSGTGQYTDGVYTGSAQGFRGDTKVSVTVQNGAIAEIKVLSYQDDDAFFSKAKDTIIADILRAQNTNIDTVSGATFSSKGMINAVANALSSAGGGTQANGETSASDAQTGTDNSNGEASGSSDKTSGNTSSGANKLNLADGVYTGSGTGFRGPISVSVTVSGGVITNITVGSYQDDTQFFSRAKDTIISEIRSAQSIHVDTVSGATFSSNGILEAVADALGLDFTNPSSAASQGGGQGWHGTKRGK